MMAIGERIHFFRILRGMTQKYLGTIVGFPERSADVRLAQYETGTRKPKAELTAALAQELSVSKPYAYKLIRQLNEELKEKGFITIAGRVNRQYFYERLYGAGKEEK